MASLKHPIRLGRRAFLVFTSCMAVATAAGGADLGTLVPGDGEDLVRTYCTTCHSEQIIIQQGLPRAEWDALLEWMVEEHAMEPLHELDRDRILSYLETHYGRHAD